MLCSHWLTTHWHFTSLLFFRDSDRFHMTWNHHGIDKDDNAKNLLMEIADYLKDAPKDDFMPQPQIKKDVPVAQCCCTSEPATVVNNFDDMENDDVENPAPDTDSPERKPGNGSAQSLSSQEEEDEVATPQRTTECYLL